MRGSMLAPGTTWLMPMPITAPSEPPIVNNGASVPPDVPLTSAMTQDTNFSAPKVSSTVRPKCPCTSASMLS